MRVGYLVLVLMAATPAAGWAEWQAKPFIGVKFGASTTFIDFDDAASERKLTLGGSVTWLGNIIGVEGEVARVPDFFQTVTPELVVSSSVTVLTGNVVLTLPRKTTEYGLRPYFVGGGGALLVRTGAREALLDIDSTLSVMDVGGGVTGFFTDRIGVNWDVRYFRSLGGKEDTGLSIGKERLSFWRASMGVAIRLGAVPGATP